MLYQKQHKKFIVISILIIILITLFQKISNFNNLKSTKGTVIYYCFFIPPGDHASSIGLENINFFLRYGVFEGNGIDYIFLVPNGSAQTNVAFPNTYKNVEIRQIENYKSDIANFYSQINLKDDLHEYFIFMNIGVRGPFVPAENSRWHHELIRAMGSNLMLGSTVSCYPRPHLQSHFLMMNRYGVEITKKVWKKCFMTNLDHESVIEMCEMGLSDYFIKMGYSFTSMERFYREKDISKIARKWKNFHGPMNTPEKIKWRKKNCDVTLNPIVVKEIDPFEVIFLKYGGDVFRRQQDQLESIHKKTVKNVKDCEKVMKINWNQA